jgi:hypothetical protein
MLKAAGCKMVNFEWAQRLLLPLFPIDNGIIHSGSWTRRRLLGTPAIVSPVPVVYY